MKRCCMDPDCAGGSLVAGSTFGPDGCCGNEEVLARSACRDRDRGSTPGADSNGRERDGGASARRDCGERGRASSVADSALGPDGSRGDWGGLVRGRPPGPDEGGGAFSRGISVKGCGGGCGWGGLSGGSTLWAGGSGRARVGGDPPGCCGGRDPDGADPEGGSPPDSGGDRHRDCLAEGGCGVWYGGSTAGVSAGGWQRGGLSG